MFFRIFFVVLMCVSTGLSAQPLQHYRGEEITVVDSNSNSSDGKATTTISRAEVLALSSSSTLSAALAVGYPSLDIRSYGSLGGVALATYRGLPAEYVSMTWNGFRLANAQHSLTDVGLFDANLVSTISVSSGASTIGATGDEGNAVIGARTPLASVDGSRITVGTSLTSYADKIRVAEASGFLRLTQPVTPEFGFSLSSVFSAADGNYPFYQSSTKSIVNRSNNDAHLSNGSLTVEYDPLSNLSLSLTSLYARSERGSPGQATVDYVGASLPNTRLFDERYLVGLSINHATSQYFSYSVRASAQSQFESYVDTVSTQRINDRYANHSNSIVYDGALHSTDWLDLLTAVSLERNTLTSNENLRADQADIWRNTYRASVGATVRSGMFDATGLIKAEANSDPDAPVVLPQLSLRYSIADWKTVVGVSYTRLYHAPTFNELYWKVGGNPELSPEKGDGVELVADVTPIDDWTLKIAGFYNSLHDQIIWQPTPQGVYSPFNVQASRIYGVESTISGKFVLSDALRLDLRGGLTVQRDENRTEGSINFGNELPYVTPVRWNIAGMLTLRDVGTLSVFNQYRAHRYVNFASDGSTRLPAVTLVNVGFRTSVITMLANLKAVLHIEIVNVADVGYAEINNYPLPGREYNFGIEFSY